MEGVAAGFCRNQHCWTCASTIFRRVVVGKDFEFLDGIDRRYDRNAACGEFVIVVSIENPIRPFRAESTTRNRLSARGAHSPPGPTIEEPVRMGFLCGTRGHGTQLHELSPFR